MMTVQGEVDPLAMLARRRALSGHHTQRPSVNVITG
jgi:hypothetical protein